MSIHLVDTDILTDLEYGNANVVRQFLRCKATSTVAVTDVNILEKLRGWEMKISQAKDRVHLARCYKSLGMSAKFLSHFEVVHVTESALHRCVGLKVEMKRLKVRGTEKPGPRDLLLASMILENAETVLVTHNVSHFRFVLPTDRIIDWPK